MAETNEIRMPGTPPGWVNAAMRLMLRTPLLQRLIGSMFALITVTGAKSGRRYTIPVQYLTHEGELVVLSQRMRRWWRNIADRPNVEMRIRGASMHARARIAADTEARAVVGDCLRAAPGVAKFYGLDAAAGITGDDIDRLLGRVAVIVVTLRPIEVELEPADLTM